MHLCLPHLAHQQQYACFGLFALLVFGASAATPPDYSKEGVVIQQFAKDLIFATDGTWTMEQSAVVRVQSEAGVRQFGVLGFDYNTDNQRLEIAYIRVRKPDGSVVETPSDHTQDISSEVSRMAPMYSDLREKQVPVKALSAGDTLEYKVRFVQIKPDVPGQFWYSQNFLSGAVVLGETLRISVPAGKYVKVASPTVKPEIHEEAGQRIYFWKAAQLDATSQAPDKKKPATTSPTAPAVQLTTFKSWEEVGRWYGQLEAERVAVTPAIQAKAAELTRGLTTDTEKQKAIYEYVSTKFRYISLSFGVGRYQPHSAQEVLSNQYGDCKDKHTLFASLLKAAGIEAWPALIGAGLKLDPDMPSPAQFNHVITVLPKGKDFAWLDTTPEVAPYGLLVSSLRDEKALVIPNTGAPSVMTTPADPPFGSSEMLKADATLAADGTLKGHFEMTVRGETELILRSAFHEVPPANWQEMVQAMIQVLGFAGTVSNVDADNPDDLEKPFHYSYDYQRTNYSDWANRRITAPLFPIAVPFEGSGEKPADPVFLGMPGELTYSATIHLPKDFSAEIPEGTKAEADFADYHTSYSVTDGVLSATRQLVIKKSKVQLSAWDDYQKFAKKLTDDQGQFIQLAATTGPARTVVAENNAEAETLIQQAAGSIQGRDLNAARDALAQAERLNPKQRHLWWTYANLYFASNDQQKGLDALGKEVQLHPNNVDVYRALAGAQAFYGHQREAVETLRTALKMTPNDAEAVSQLASLLISNKQYKEVQDLVHGALDKAPDNAPLQLALTEALLRDGRKEEGIQAAQALTKNKSDALTLNQAGWLLVDTSTDLPLAKEYAERSISKLESEFKEITLSSLRNEDLSRIYLLDAAWDTLGWVYFQSGDLGTAEKYIDASWRLGQDAEVADHLGQIYLKEGKEPAAIRVWQLALAANPTLEDARERLRKLGASTDINRIRLSGKERRTARVLNSAMSPAEELGKLRTAGIPDLPKQEASAEFFVLFSASKVEDAQFISGSDALKSAREALLKVHYEMPFPDGGPERIARRGILSCSTYTSPSCQFVLLLPSTTRK